MGDDSDAVGMLKQSFADTGRIEVHGHEIAAGTDRIKAEKNMIEAEGAQKTFAEITNKVAAFGPVFAADQHDLADRAEGIEIVE